MTNTRTGSTRPLRLPHPGRRIALWCASALLVVLSLILLSLGALAQQRWAWSAAIVATGIAVVSGVLVNRLADKANRVIDKGRDRLLGAPPPLKVSASQNIMADTLYEDDTGQPWCPLSGSCDIVLTVEGTSPEAVILRSLRAVALARRPPRLGTVVHADGLMTERRFELLLDVDPPRLAPDWAPLKVSLDDPEIIRITPRTYSYEIDWQVQLDWFWSGNEGTLVDDDGDPFRLSIAVHRRYGTDKRRRSSNPRRRQTLGSVPARRLSLLEAGHAVPVDFTPGGLLGGSAVAGGSRADEFSMRNRSDQVWRRTRLRPLTSI